MKRSFENLLASAALVMAMTLSGCSGSAPGARHPLYIKGIKLEKAERYEEAAAVFERCLRQDPDNRPAHVHLGMLYEDHLEDPYAALYHYRRGSAGDAGDAHAEFARSAGQAILDRLVARELDKLPKSAPEPDPEAEEGLEELKEQVRELASQRAYLLERLKEQSQRLKATEEALSQLRETLSTPLPNPDADTSDSPPAKASAYKVQKGDTLMGISRQQYGTSSHWQALRDYNKDVLKGSDRLIPGMSIKIPPAKDLEK